MIGETGNRQFPDDVFLQSRRSEYYLQRAETTTGSDKAFWIALGKMPNSDLWFMSVFVIRLFSKENLSLSNKYVIRTNKSTSFFFHNTFQPDIAIS